MPSPGFDTVARVTVEETIDAFTVGLAQHPSGEGGYLILQCALTPPDDQDAATDMHTYCLMDEQGAVHYGGIQRAELTGTTLRFRFHPDAAEELGIRTPERELALAIPPADSIRLRDGLHRVLTYGNPARRPKLAGI
ncbi:MAG TPA: Imm10 family immunity protein [Actinocrinis sp.]|uniref:Imm10 family immunity protein n=1 Tax=Actinocrinis sp. TaxID=1920516 RepID=UPI002D21FC09|nr:Imm10 family immunity protein [Actinocrinis sp.]HZU54763.1 Imm10 family immunity protein [Actinocrinis sp.]